MLRVSRFTLSLLLVAIVLAGGRSLFAQPVFDAQSTATATVTSGSPTLSWSHTTAPGVSRIMLVSVSTNVVTSTGATVSTVTYNGSPLTLRDAISDGSPATTRTEVWYMLAPPSVTANVVVTFGSISPGNSIRAVTGAVTFSNANQAAPDTATNFSTGSSPASVTLNPTTTTDIILDYLSVQQHNGGVTATHSGSQTLRYNLTESPGSPNGDRGVIGASSQRLGAAPSTPMSWTLDRTNRYWTMIGVRIQVAPPGADVEVRQYATPDPVEPGGVLTYVFLIQNNGPATATGVTLTNTIPGTTTFISSNTTQGSCSGSPAVTCNIGTLALGATATVTIQVQAPMTGGLIATNTGTVTTTSTDPVTPNTASATSYVLVQGTVCNTQPGKDGAGGTLAGIVNSYWPGTANASVGATSITVGTRRAGGVDITAGDLILIMQMQDAGINSENDDRYGDGLGITGGTTGIGSGYTNANNAGRYEYAIATNTIGAGGGSLTFTAVGGGNGLMYAYTNAAATGTMGQRRFQVIRVPQYASATLGATLTAATWNGTTGGVLAVDIAGDLALGSTTVSVNGVGFRGGAGLGRTGAGTPTPTATDYRNVVGTNAHGAKGEGIAGTPEWVLDGGVNTDTGPQGYPNGDFARGAPGNAGGGGTDANPSANDQNSGGGGGANWGRGGGGGNSWQTNLATGGFGGGPFYDSPGRVVLGGGGGAGTRNNSSGIAAAGGAGGGIVLIRAGNLTGTGTITANGANAFNDTLNDGGGGGGAGGSIVILSRGGGLGGLTVRANGGRGGDAWRTEPPPGLTYPGERHGPGGGGGGGYIALNGTPAVSSVTGGGSGITTTVNDTFGAQPGAPGNVVLSASFDQITGVRSGCVDMQVTTNSDSPDPVFAGNNITYTQVVRNNSTNVPAQNVTFTQTTPAGTTFVSMTPPAGWSCTTPSIGGTGTVSCTYSGPFPANTSSPNFIFVVATDPALADGSTITQPASVSTTSPETTLANNSLSASTLVQRRVDVAITKAVSPTTPVFEGATLTYTLVVTNNGPSRATNVVMSDPLPAGLSFTSVVPGGPTCSHSMGTVTCNLGAMNPGATHNITITGVVTVNTTMLTNTATVTRTETDTNPSNDSATVQSAILAPTAVRMVDVAAVQDRNGRVVVTWETSFETDNLGFNVYRQGSDGRRELVNHRLIVGSAFLSANRILSSGRTYRWKDTLRQPGDFVQYWIEDIDLNRSRTLHGPVTPKIVATVDDVENVATFGETVSSRGIASNARISADGQIESDLGTNSGIFVSPRGLGAPVFPSVVPGEQAFSQQWELAAGDAARLLVTEEGWYRVTKRQLLDNGFDPGTDPHRLSLFMNGAEQPLLINAPNGVFDEESAIEFHGVGIDTPAAGARPYWLVAGAGENRRVGHAPGSSGGAAIEFTPMVFERIERSSFFAALTTNGDRDNFYGAIISSSRAAQNISVENIDRTRGDATLEVVIQGGTMGPHGVRAELNGHLLGTVQFVDRERRVATFSVPPHAVLDGVNVLHLTALEGNEDFSLVESLRFTYPHKLVADGDALKVQIAGSSAATVTGFTVQNVRAVDVTDPSAPLELETNVTPSGSEWSASFVAPAGGSRTVLVFGNTRIKSPAAIVSNQGSSWNALDNEADLLILSAAHLIPAAEPLVSRRESEGLKVAVINVQDLYDEFGFGIRGPEAIRDFLKHTRDWTRKPKYVLLLGDASFDPRNYYGLGKYDFVPTRLIPTEYNKTASDVWLADFDGTGIPSLALGRLPARTLAQAQVMIGKIVARGTTPDAAGPWSNRVAFVADRFDGMYDFAAYAAELEPLVPEELTKSTILATGTTAVNRTNITNTFNSGQLLITYCGHGSVEIWS
ncbi:MAG TPA: C25 family cysteine peptidase, partial [Thermoanaerobaculia bacterium]